MTTKLLAVAAGLLGAAAILGCVVSDYDPALERGPIGAENVYLYISNETTERRWERVTLSVYVDGKLRERRSLTSVFANHDGPHGVPEEFKLYVPPGAHTIRVVADGARAGAETQIVVVGHTAIHVSAAFSYQSRRTECSPAGTSVHIHVLPGPPGWC